MKTIGQCTLMAMLVLVSSMARAELTIVIDSPVHGAGLVGDEVRVEGRVDGLIPEHTYQVTAQAYPATLTRDVSGMSGTFSVTIPMFPKPWDTDPAPLAYPYRSWAKDEERVFRPILVELADLTDSEVLTVRERILMHDLRYYEDSRMMTWSDLTPMAVRYVLTPAGLDHVAEFLPDLFPVSDPGRFDGVLASYLGSGFQTTNDFSGRECEAVDEYPALQETAAYTRLNKLHAVCKAFNELLTAQGKPELCPFLPDEFEADDVTVCVTQVDAWIHTVESGPVSKVRLHAEPGLVSAQTFLTPVDGVADVTLHAYLRYRGGVYALQIPKQNLPEETMMCLDQSFHASKAASDALDDAEDEDYEEMLLSVDPDGSEPQLLDVRQTRAGRFELIQYDASLDGYCDDEFIVERVRETFDSVEDDIEELIGDAWNHQYPVPTQQSESLRLALKPFEALSDTNPRIDFVTEFNFIDVLEDRLSDSTLQQGLVFDLATQAFPLEWTLIDGAINPSQLFYVPNDEFLEDGTLTPLDEIPFDLAVTVSTGTLNQVLRAASSTDILNFTLDAPTYEELDLCVAEVGECARDALGSCVCTTGSTQRTGPALLDGETLADMIPEFAVLGSTEVKIRMRPTLAPVVSMWQGLLFFHIGQHLVEFVEFHDDGSETVWLEASVDVFQEEWSFAFGSADDKISPATELGPYFNVTVLHHGFETEPTDPTYVMEAMLDSFLIPAMDSALQALPIPEFARVPRLGYVPFATIDLERRNDADNVSIFANLD